jgi:hypothetical protein
MGDCAGPNSPNCLAPNYTFLSPQNIDMPSVVTLYDGLAHETPLCKTEPSFLVKPLRPALTTLELIQVDLLCAGRWEWWRRAARHGARSFGHTLHVSLAVLLVGGGLIFEYSHSALWAARNKGVSGYFSVCARPLTSSSMRLSQMSSIFSCLSVRLQQFQHDAKLRWH